jgi:hypothetical protein
VERAHLDRRFLRALIAAFLATALSVALIPSGTCAMALPPTRGHHDVSWLGQSPLPDEMAAGEQQDREDRARARIAIVLTLACTLLSIYDLFLLASGA